VPCRRHSAPRGRKTRAGCGFPGVDARSFGWGSIIRTTGALRRAVKGIEGMTTRSQDRGLLAVIAPQRQHEDGVADEDAEIEQVLRCGEPLPDQESIVDDVVVVHDGIEVRLDHRFAAHRRDRHQHPRIEEARDDRDDDRQDDRDDLRRGDDRDQQADGNADEDVKLTGEPVEQETPPERHLEQPGRPEEEDEDVERVQHERRRELRDYRRL